VICFIFFEDYTKLKIPYEITPTLIEKNLFLVEIFLKVATKTRLGGPHFRSTGPGILFIGLNLSRRSKK